MKRLGRETFTNIVVQIYLESKEFMKPITTYEQRIDVLIRRGLTFDDKDRLLHYLKHIGYYRLSGYFKYFQDESNEFRDETDFETVLKTYVFDRKLRMLLLDALERIEVSFKAQICDQMCFETLNDRWYQDSSNFAQDRDHNAFSFVTKKINSAVGNSKEAWVKKASKDGCDLTTLPSWMICNILTFGQISFIFSRLANNNQKKIAKQYSLNGRVLRSWMQSLTTVRNICAHHNRLWNKSIDTPFFMPKILEEYHLEPNKLFSVLVVTAMLMEKISPRTKWPVALKSLLVEYSSVSREEMGFPVNWETVFDEAIKKLTTA